MGLKDFFKKIWTGANKEQSQQYGTGAISASSGSTFYTSEENIIKIPEFMSAIDMIANDVADAKFYDTKIEYRDGDTIRHNKIKKESNLNYLLNFKPNDYQSSVEFWKNNIFNLFIRGAFFFYIYRNKKGVPTELISIHPHSITKVKDKNGTFGYEITLFEGDGFSVESKKTIVPYEDIFSHYMFDLENISDMTFRNVYSSLLEQIGLKNQYDLIQLNQSARILAHVKIPDNGNEKQVEQIKESMKTFFTNAKQIDKSSVLVTDPKIEVELLGSDKTQIKSAVDPEFVLSIMTKFANVFHIPLPKLNIASTGQSFYKSREGINIDYMADAISPILSKITSKMTSLIYKKKGSEFIFNIDKLMSVDHATRAEYSSKMRQNAILTTNELRILNGYSPVDGGDKLYGNGTLVELGKGSINGGNEDKGIEEDKEKDEDKSKEKDD